MDAFGQAGLDFIQEQHDEFIYVESETMEDDVIPVAHLFRSLNEMPIVEQKALDHVEGKVLDVGGGVGSHSLFLQNKNIDVTMLDISSGLCEVSTNRGVKKVIEADYFTCDFPEKYDTLIFMMNGIGIGGSFDTLQKTIEKAQEILNPGGSIIFDSTDISFCYAQEDGSMIVPLNITYHGFVKFRLKYKGKQDEWFNWSYFDFEKLKEVLPEQYNLELIHEDGFAYSAKITGF
jgi:ubiquinone/menaquinone biosynthesis C-methylase UbiE